MTQKLMSLFKAHLLAKHDLILYPYQLYVAQKLFDALIQNLRLTANATEEDIKKLRVIEIPIEFSRQSGKTTAIVHAIEFIMLFFPELFKRPVRIGIFAPQREQAKTDFDRLKFALAKSTNMQVKLDDLPNEEENNAKTIVLPNGASCYIFPVTATSKPESKSLDLIVFEESQDLDDKIIKEQIWPMGASTNAARVYIGTAGTRICYFYRLGQSELALKLYYDQIVRQRREIYEATNNALHLIYEQSVKGEIEKHGRDSDEIARPYFGKWLIGTGQFVTQEDLEAIETDRKRTYHDTHSDCYVGIDTAKHPDSTVVTVIRYNKDTHKKELLNWLELRGENYQDQYDIISEFINPKKYKVVAIAIDSTGQGDFMPDMFQAHSEWQDENSGLYRIKFSAVSKDMMYKNLKVSIRELLTDLPQTGTREADRFKQQMLDLQQEYKGQLLSVHHPDDPNAHDDYSDSWALAEWAYARWNEDSSVSVSMVTTEKERKVERDDENRIVEHWPGYDDD
jgi:hypothetical protein